MKNKKAIKHKINQKTAARKHTRRRILNKLKGSTKTRSQHMPVRVPTLPTLPSLKRKK